MEEKKEKTMQEKLRMRAQALWALGICLIVIGGLWMDVQLSSIIPYNELRSDEYMNDPTIPYNERDNATYTFTDQWLKDTYWRLAWYAIPGGVLFAIGVALYSCKDWIINGKEVHKTLCKGDGEARYCSECGLKLSELEKK